MNTFANPPRATYRVQFGPGFTFNDARDIVDYLATLGISHMYASPYLKARPGSTHGYDITDHNQLNPELGDEASFEALCSRLSEHGLAQVVDFVPNHMGIGKADTPWWLDVLEWGEESPYAEYFDIDFDSAKPELRGKVLVPFLGDHYGKVLSAGDLKLRFDADSASFSVWYYEHRFPVTPPEYRRILGWVESRVSTSLVADEAIAELRRLVRRFADLARASRSARQRTNRRKTADELRRELAALVKSAPPLREAIESTLEDVNKGAFEASDHYQRLHRLLEHQPYRLAYWLVAAEEINYRRFFQITDLAGIRIELPHVFQATHRFILQLIADGKVHGLRIDHIDGLFDPEDYLRRLQAHVSPPGNAEHPARSGGANASPFYIVVEKILASHERLPETWPIAGTTGYEFLNRSNALFVDGAGEQAMIACYRKFINDDTPFEETVYLAKKHAMDQELASELRVLANEFNKLTESNWLTRDYTLVGLRQAMREIVASFPVYRTYVSRRGTRKEDRRYIEWAIAHGRRRSLRADMSVFDFIHDILTGDLVRGRDHGFNRRECYRLAMKFQQYTGPVMAKGVEDTAFYRYHPLISLNEVGGEPTRFGLSVAAFHKFTQAQVKAWPHAMLATATHDTKRGEDVRARINVLSEIPEEWAARVSRWSTLNSRFKTTVDDSPAPSCNDEYLLYQTLVGAWPTELGGTEEDLDAAALERFRDRITAYMMKAVREAKVHSNWIAPKTPYEEALTTFVQKILTAAPFIADLRSFYARVAEPGVVNSLAQTTLKLTAPGVPDIYQGCDLWDLSLVDPDNRRPVDYALRRRVLEDVQRRLDTNDAAAAAGALLDDWREGGVKPYVIWRLLRLRRERPQLFCDAKYMPLATKGSAAEHVCAFARLSRDSFLIVAVPRLNATLMRGEGRWPLGPSVWRDTRVMLPKELALDAGAVDAFTARSLSSRRRRSHLGSFVAASELFHDFPAAALVVPHAA